MEAKFIHYKGSVITLAQNADGFWQDDKGTLYAYADSSTSIDDLDRCGISFLTLPSWAVFVELNESCEVHDTMYQTPIYQAYHTRSEADAALEALLSKAGYPILGGLFSWIARVLGGSLWENPKTR